MDQATFLVDNINVNKVLKNSTNYSKPTNITSDNSVNVINNNNNNNNNNINTNIIISSKKPTRIVENVYYL
jgi:hypothetical protein